MPAATRIFEDQDADAGARPSKGTTDHKRTPSVGQFLRGRRKENDVANTRRNHTPSNETPLGERQINSPPQPRRIPISDEPKRPTMHKKSKSSLSIKSLGKEKLTESASVSSMANGKDESKPKKSKSSTNLASLLRKKSKKNLNEEPSKDQENVTPPSSANIDTNKSPIWAQYATQPLEDGRGRIHHPPAKKRTVQEEIDLYTPKVVDGQSPYPSCNNQTPRLTEKLPQRPYLEHRPSSRSSIFKEELEKDTVRETVVETEIKSCEARTVDVKASDRPQPTDQRAKRASRVLDAITTFNLKSRHNSVPIAPETQDQPRAMSEAEINSALELLLDARDIAPNMRGQMRALDVSMKIKLIQNQRGGSGSSAASSTPVNSDCKEDQKSRSRPTTRDGEDAKETKTSRSRPRSRAFTLTKRDASTSSTKKQKPEESVRSRSKARPKSEDMSSMRPGSARSLKSSTSISSLFSISKPDTAATPGDFIHYLQEVQKPALVEIGKMHKLRILLRNESIAWTDSFVKTGGMDEVVSLLYRIIKVEWREEHEDSLLHETLLCLKGLCTTSLALHRLDEIQAELFPTLLKMLFDEERKGPSEFSTRSVIISLLFAHLSSALHNGETTRTSHARTMLGYLKDPTPEDAKKPFAFIEQMHVSRPYRVWCKEVVNVTKEVFWIFLHHLNVIPVPSSTTKDLDEDASYATRHFPPPRLPHPAAPYVGGVEWEATSYLATHLDLLNGILASLPTSAERNLVRQEMQASGWERVMGATMRTCKEKFYGGVHEGLRVWVGAAKEDGWRVEDVRAGPPREERSPRKRGPSPVKKGQDDDAPKLKLDIGFAVQKPEDGWI